MTRRLADCPGSVDPWNVRRLRSVNYRHRSVSPDERPGSNPADDVGGARGYPGSGCSAHVIRKPDQPGVNSVQVVVQRGVFFLDESSERVALARLERSGVGATELLRFAQYRRPAASALHTAPGRDVAYGAERAVGELGQLPQRLAGLVLLDDERFDPCLDRRVGAWAGAVAGLRQRPEVRSRGDRAPAHARGRAGQSASPVKVNNSVGTVPLVGLTKESTEPGQSPISDAGRFADGDPPSGAARRSQAPEGLAALRSCENRAGSDLHT